MADKTQTLPRSDGGSHVKQHESAAQVLHPSIQEEMRHPVVDFALLRRQVGLDGLFHPRLSHHHERHTQEGQVVAWVDAMPECAHQERHSQPAQCGGRSANQRKPSSCACINSMHRNGSLGRAAQFLHWTQINTIPSPLCLKIGSLSTRTGDHDGNTREQ